MTISYVPRDCKVFSADVRYITAGRINATATVVSELSVGAVSVTSLTVDTLTCATLSVETARAYNTLSTVPRLRRYHYDPVTMTHTTFTTNGTANLCRIATLGTFGIFDQTSCVAVELGDAWTLSADASYTVALAIGPQATDLAPGNAIKIMAMVPVNAFGVEGVVGPVIASSSMFHCPEIVVTPISTATQYLYVARWLGSVSFTTPLNFYIMRY